MTNQDKPSDSEGEAGSGAIRKPVLDFENQVRERFRGSFEIGESLGEGGMGAVFRVTRNGTSYALKVLLPHAGADPKTHERFILEGEILKAIDHPNVLKVYEIGEIDGWPYLLCELIDGGGLDELLKNGPLTWDRAFSICESVLDGLSAAHEKNIIHRDLKPSNILLTKAGVPKVADFGIAKAGEGFESRKTTTGIIVGTPAYIAPEALKEEKLTPRADLFSIGVMLYELITGELPWKAANVQELLTTRLNNKIPALSQQIRGVPRTLDALLQTAMAPRPVDRFPSAATFKTALRRTRVKLVENLGEANLRQTAQLSGGLNRLTMTAGAGMAGTSAGLKGSGLQASGVLGSGARAKSSIGGGNREASGLPEHLPDRLAPTRIVESASPNPAVMVLGLAGVLGIFLIAGLLFLRPAGPGPLNETPVMRGVTTVALLEPEQRFADQIITLMGSGLTGPGFTEKLSDLDQFDQSSQARILFNIWNDAPDKYYLDLASRFIKIPHPLALKSIVWLLFSMPDANIEGLRINAADRLVELLEMHSDPSVYPQPENALKKFESILATTVEDARAERPEVIRAVIRYVGWLGSSRTSSGCIDAMLEAPSHAGWLDTMPGTSPDTEIRRALKNIPTQKAGDEFSLREEDRPSRDPKQLGGRQRIPTR